MWQGKIIATEWKKLFFASFASGTQFIVKDILEKQIPDIEIYQLFDGAVLFNTDKPYDKLNMYCFNNIFSVIAYAENKNGDIESFIRQIVNARLQNDTISNNNKNHKTFRVVISSENQFVSINEKLKIRIEKLISSQSKLKLDRSNSDTEFWILYRTEGFCYFLKRLSKHTAYEKILNKGELHPEITFLMNWLSEPDKNDTVLDPFCGNGSIPLRRALNFPAKKIFAFDYDDNMVSIVKKKIIADKFLSNMKDIVIKKVDINYLDKELLQESIDKIVTDPPWGSYEKINMEIEEFCKMILLKMEKVLKNNGIIVLLFGRNNYIEKLIKTIPNLSLEKNYNVLISGRKANLIKFRKRT
jgi:tRNA (guanine6-N2)-methyltransferase